MVKVSLKTLSMFGIIHSDIVAHALPLASGGLFYF